MGCLWLDSSPRLIQCLATVVIVFESSGISYCLLLMGLRISWFSYSFVLWASVNCLDGIFCFGDCVVFCHKAIVVLHLHLLISEKRWTLHITTLSSALSKFVPSLQRNEWNPADFCCNDKFTFQIIVTFFCGPAWAYCAIVDSPTFKVNRCHERNRIQHWFRDVLTVMEIVELASNAL